MGHKHINPSFPVDNERTEVSFGPSHSDSGNVEYPAYEPTPFVPNPVPVVEPKAMNCPCPKPPPPKPVYWDKDYSYVTKHELNRVLQNIAAADIFNDTSTTGTTVTVGGVPKGTKFSKITFAQLVEKMLYPKEELPTDFITREELAMILARVAFTGSYDDLLNKPNNFDFVYPSNELNTEVVRDLGGFQVGDSLEGMTIARILEKLLCNASPTPVPPEPDIWGNYEWKSDLYDLQTGDTEICLETFAPQMIRDMEAAKLISEEAYETLLTSGKYELHVVCATYDKGDVSKYNTVAIIGSDDSRRGPNPQTTIPFSDDVPQELSWVYDDDDKLIRILHGSVMDDLCILLLKR